MADEVTSISMDRNIYKAIMWSHIC